MPEQSEISKKLSPFEQSYKFAPVIIPTLCRYDHFKNCLESLMRCTHADKTDVYIGLDYPSKDAHWDGYHKISEYLDNIAFTHNFQSLIVIRRIHNLGTGFNGNLFDLMRYVLSFEETLILTEDDNIFAESFLDYINKGLRKFRDDKSVLAINGYRHFYNIKSKDNTYFRQNVDFSAWGYGIWKDRIEQSFRDLTNRHYLLKKAMNPINWYKLYRNGLNRLLKFCALVRGRSETITDNTLSVYMAINDMDVIMPVESLVRNMGWDNSGENCHDNYELSKIHTTQPISEEKYFTFSGSGKEFYDDNRQIYRNESYGRIKFSDLLKRLSKHILKS